jgi:alpha/beta superfamily hydrolase
VANAQAVSIEGPAGRLEGAWREGDGVRGAITIAHPHPLYGGTLHNPVVFHADRALNRAGWTTLRFNFRGVGASEGLHDEGRGEVADLGAAAAWVRLRARAGPLLLVGYSFGARCAVAAAIAEPAVAGVVAIGLPVRIWSFDDLPSLARPFAVVQGTDDEFGSIEEVASAIVKASPPGTLYAVPGASHLFPRQAAEVARLVVAAVDRISPAG